MTYLDYFIGGASNIQTEYHSNGSVKSIGYYIYSNPDKLKPGDMMFGALHREDGPAYQAFTMFDKLIRDEYWQYDEHHREDGPAIVLYTTSGRIRKVDWFYRGNCVNLLINEWMGFHGVRWYRMSVAHRNLFRIQVLDKLRRIYG